MIETLLDSCSWSISRIWQLIYTLGLIDFFRVPPRERKTHKIRNKESNLCNCKTDEKQVGDIWIPPKIQIRNAFVSTMPPKKQSGRARAIPTAESTQRKKRRTSAQSQSPLLSPDTLDHLAQKVTERVTTSIKEELSSMIAAALQSGATNSQGSITSNITHDTNLTSTLKTGIHDATENIIQESVASAIVTHTERIAGKTTGGFVSTSVPIDARVSDKIKSKIWSKQFINCSNLLSKDKNNKEQISIEVEHSDNSGKLTIHQVPKTTGNDTMVSTMHDWITPWNRFSAIYCLKYPDEQAKLSKHLEAVRDIADVKGNWQTYDIDFRTLISQGQVEWGDIHMELYVNARLPTTHISKQTTNRYLTKRIPKGACFQYHSGKQCAAGQTCRFQHKCYNCGGTHPFTQCTKQIQQPFRVLPRFKYQTSYNKQSNFTKATTLNLIKKVQSSSWRFQTTRSMVFGYDGTQTEESDDVDNNLSKDIEDDFCSYGDMSTIQAQWVKEEDENEEWRTFCHNDKEDIKIQKTKTGNSNFILHPKQEGFAVKYMPDINQVQIHIFCRSPFPVWYPSEVLKDDRYKLPILHDDEPLSIQRDNTPENTHTPTSLILKNATLVTMVIRHLSYNGMSVVWIKLPYKGKIITVVVLLNTALQLKHASDDSIPKTTVSRKKDFFADAEIRNVVVLVLNCPLEFRIKSRTVIELFIKTWKGKDISFCMEARIDIDGAVEYKIPELQTQNCEGEGTTGHEFKNGIICKTPKTEMRRWAVSRRNQPKGIEQPNKCQSISRDVMTRKMKMGYVGSEGSNGLAKVLSILPRDTGEIQITPSQEVTDKKYVSVDPGEKSTHHGTKCNSLCDQNAVMGANPTAGVAFPKRFYGFKRKERKVARKKKGNNQHINLNITETHTTLQNESGIDTSQVATRICDKLHKEDEQFQQGRTGFKMRDIDNCGNANGINDPPPADYCQKKKRSTNAKIEGKFAYKPSTCSNGLDRTRTYDLNGLNQIFGKIMTLYWIVVLMLLPITAGDSKSRWKESARNVTRCPTKEEWQKFSITKNCSRYSNELQYHCVLNDERTGFVELCSPVFKIVGGFCAEYNRGRGRIQPQMQTSCEGICPFAYNSTDMFRYPDCYQILRNNDTIDSGVLISTPRKEFQEYPTTLEQPSGYQKSTRYGGNDGSAIAIAYIVIVILLGIIISIVLYKCREISRSKQSSLSAYANTEVHVHNGETILVHLTKRTQDATDV